MIHKAYLKRITSIQNVLMNLDNYQIVIKRPYHNVDTEISIVNLLDIKRALKSANQPVLEGHACISTNFLLCDDSKKKDCKFHINKMTGFFVCEICKRVGPWNVLEKKIKPNKTPKIMEELKSFQKSFDTLPNCSEEWNEVKKSTVLVEKLPIEKYKMILSKFSLQDVPQEIMSQLNVYYQESTETLYFPLLAFQSFNTGYRTLSVNPTSSKTVPESHASGVLIYKQKNIKSDGTAILVPNIEDLLALATNKAANVIICLPYGLQSIPQQILPSLESYNKLILWFGNDEPSWDTARHFAKKLDEKRCYFVRPIDDQPQAQIAVSLGLDLKKIIKNAQPIWHKSITTFRSLRQDILSDLQNSDKVQGVKWNRFPTLNNILKGHRRGEFTVLTGPTGCGKTTFMSEYSLDLAMQGINTLWGSFEIRNARLAKTMLQQMAGVPLDANLDKFDSFANEFEKLPLYFMTFHGQQDIKDVLETIEHATYVHDIGHVIIDNIQFMMGMADEPKYMDRFWKQDKIIASFRTFATKFNCHVSLVIHPRKERDDGELTTASIFGGAKASQEADNIMIVQDKRLSSVKGKKYLQIAKNRFSGDLGIMLLDFDKTSLSYATKNKIKSEISDNDTDFIAPNESIL